MEQITHEELLAIIGAARVNELRLTVVIQQQNAEITRLKGENTTLKATITRTDTEIAAFIAPLIRGEDDTP